MKIYFSAMCKCNTIVTIKDVPGGFVAGCEKCDEWCFGRSIEEATDLFYEAIDYQYL